MQVKVKSQLPRETQWANSRKVWMVTRAREAVRKVSMSVERRIKSNPPQGMPRDTGRASAGWGHWGGVPVQNAEAGPGDAVWEETDQGMTITQGTNIEYVEGLNAGHSQQSPAGFIDAAEDAGQRALDREIDEIVGQFGL